jgi:cobalt-zinc-cadmium efflux system protein
MKTSPEELRDTHNESIEIHREASENLSFALILNLLFNIVVISGGLLTNSVAIISDALHDLSDTISIIIAWILEKLSQKESDSKFTYGYQRFSIIGALFNSTIVIIASATVAYEAFNRLFEVQMPDAEGMVLIAILGIIFKGFSLIKLHKGKTFNEKAISIHMFGDVFEWIALLIISIILVFVDIPLLDPIASILVSFWVIYNLSKTFIASTKILLQSIPADIDINLLKKELLDIDNVLGLEDFHIWSLDGIDNILTTKVRVLKTDEDSIKLIKNDLKTVTDKHKINQTNFEFIY